VRYLSVGLGICHGEGDDLSVIAWGGGGGGHSDNKLGGELEMNHILFRFSPSGTEPRMFKYWIIHIHCKKRLAIFPSLARQDVTYQTLPGREYFNYSPLGTRKLLTFF
jgi:hypothetical protein